MALLQLTKSGVRWEKSSEDWSRLREQFDQQHCVCLSSFVDDECWKLIQTGLKEAEFKEFEHPGVGLEGCVPMETVNPNVLLHFLVNDLTLFRLVRRITGCGHIRSFLGRTYCMSPNSHHYDSWHQDLVDFRMVALSLNLGEKVDLGGILQIRDFHTKKMIYEARGIGPGDAILFRIAPSLEHRVTRVRGTTPRIVFAGWFKSHPDFLTMIRQPEHANMAVIQSL